MNRDSEYLALLKEAESENTSGDRLKELASHESKAIRQAIASNSNTPIETLLILFFKTYC